MKKINVMFFIFLFSMLNVYTISEDVLKLIKGSAIVLGGAALGLLPAYFLCYKTIDSEGKKKAGEAAREVAIALLTGLEEKGVITIKK